MTLRSAKIPSVYLQLAAAPDGADIFDEAVWFACNEALGKFLDLNEFRSQAKQAKRLPKLPRQVPKSAAQHADRRQHAVHFGPGLDGLCNTHST